MLAWRAGCPAAEEACWVGAEADVSRSLSTVLVVEMILTLLSVGRSCKKVARMCILALCMQANSMQRKSLEPSSPLMLV